MSAVSVGGDLVHYQVLGRGRAVLLLHGWIGSWRYWVPSMQQLHLKYKVYAVDMFGYGDSAKNPRRYTLDEQVRMVSDFLKTMQLKKVAIVGHGFGAWIAAELARREPSTIARMLLFNAPLFVPDGLGGRTAPRPVLPATKPLNRDALDRTIYDGTALRRDTPLASLGRGGYDDKPVSRPRQPAPTDPTDPTATQSRLLQRLKQEAAAKAAQHRPTPPAPPQPDEQNPLYRLLAGQEPAALLNRTVKRTDQQYEKIAQDVSRTDPQVIAQTALYYDAGAMLDALRVLPMPVMLVHGSDDPLIEPPEETVWTYLTHEKEDVCVPVPVAAGHFPMFDYESYPRLLAGFLDAPDLTNMEIKERWRRRSR